MKELKEEREKPKREEALEAKAAAKKKAEDERMAKLTAAEQQKVRVFPFSFFFFLVGVVDEWMVGRVTHATPFFVVLF